MVCVACALKGNEIVRSATAPTPLPRCTGKKCAMEIMTVKKYLQRQFSIVPVTPPPTPHQIQISKAPRPPIWSWELGVGSLDCIPACNCFTMLPLCLRLVPQKKQQKKKTAFKKLLPFQAEQCEKMFQHFFLFFFSFSKFPLMSLEKKTLKLDETRSVSGAVARGPGSSVSLSVSKKKNELRDVSSSSCLCGCSQLGCLLLLQNH